MKRNERGISLIILVIAIVLMAALVALGVILIVNKNDTKVENKTEEILTERQKEILTEQGLSVDYEELGYRQQKTITNIEKALTHLENKYPERTFEYKSYEIPNTITKYEIVYINTINENGNEDVIEVQVYNDGSMLDNFNDVLLKNKNSDIILKEAKSLLNNKENSVRIFSDDGVSDFYLFINNEVVSEEKYFEFVEDIKEYVVENEILCSCRVSLVDGNTFVKLTKYNFSDFYKDYIQDESFYNNGN